MAAVLFAQLLIAIAGACAWAPASLAQEATLEILPVRPINFDVVFRQQSYAPNDREITIQAGLTALRYGNFETRALYRHFSYQAPDQGVTTDHAVLLQCGRTGLRTAPA